MIKRIGYIGLGLMGKPIAGNLLKAGFELVVHNRSPQAVEELVAYVRKITGVELEVGAETGGDHLCIYVGAAAKRALGQVEWNDLGDDGFVLKSGAGGIYIAGAEDLGTLYGVYHLLEKHLGVRWFMPGEIGEVVPRGDLDRARTLLRVRMLVADDDQAPSDQRQDRMLADQVPVAVVLGIDRDGGVAQHRLRARRCDYYIFVFSIFYRIFKVP